jgi:hypothetical protein
MILRKKDDEQVRREFKQRQNRQVLAIAVSLFLVLLCAVIYRRPDLFGRFSKTSLFEAQALIILVFINFSNFNWQCPACGKGLGADIARRVCRKCGSRLQ